MRLDDFDALALPGGFEPSGFYEEALSPPFLKAIHHFADAGKPIASVCVSSLCLGAAGILKDKPATIYHQIGGKRKAQLEETGARFVDRPVVVSDQLITSTGPGTALEVAFTLLELLTDPANVAELKERMRIPPPQTDWHNKPQV